MPVSQIFSHLVNQGNIHVVAAHQTKGIECDPIHKQNCSVIYFQGYFLLKFFFIMFSYFIIQY